ncbi:MAG: gamma carbonic anhydrase family protein [Gammaproteobacteria bacterium]|nr:gamma carbonic anhydrase family protein [Gammaproteobacteria bacterium]MBT8152216.1 gamma carbonic anhydrase family protein [Gammaproteobacteria bacterium]NND38844.1 gamma carbonic anhydrase family protein [Pseudomonadales bacterium]NNL11067.1 gamma carbonic anhydrase family protein [Pseudomonadales bacterium]RZV54467.1 MAG: gamma carbonic anhydrase family protein [Pseudomonadales bacterium]
MPNIRAFGQHSPSLAPDVYIDPAATVIGKVELGQQASVWPGAILRGDVNRIAVGARSNIQDGSIIHVSRPTAKQAEGYPTLLDDEVTIGHGVVLHGCRIESQVLVGNRAVVMDGAILQRHVMVGANALVPPGKLLQSGYLYIGSPCKQARPLSDAEIAGLATSANNYVELGKQYRLAMQEA